MVLLCMSSGYMSQMKGSTNAGRKPSKTRIPRRENWSGGLYADYPPRRIDDMSNRRRHFLIFYQRRRHEAFRVDGAHARNVDLDQAVVVRVAGQLYAQIVEPAVDCSRPGLGRLRAARPSPGDEIVRRPGCLSCMFPSFRRSFSRDGRCARGNRDPRAEAAARRPT